MQMNTSAMHPNHMSHLCKLSAIMRAITRNTSQGLKVSNHTNLTTITIHANNGIGNSLPSCTQEIVRRPLNGAEWVRYTWLTTSPKKRAARCFWTWTILQQNEYRSLWLTMLLLKMLCQDDLDVCWKSHPYKLSVVGETPPAWTSWVNTQLSRSNTTYLVSLATVMTSNSFNRPRCAMLPFSMIPTSYCTWVQSKYSETKLKKKIICRNVT